MSICSSCFYVLALIAPQGSSDSAYSGGSDTMRVVGTKPKISEHIIVAKEEQKYGRVDDVNKLILMKPGVNLVPESGSTFLVRGEGPFDNEFRVYGVPVFAPSHFGSSVFANHSSTMIASVADVQLVTDAIYGRYSGISGSVISQSPGIVRTGYPQARNRPEISANLGIYNQDVILSVPFHNETDFYQIAFTNTNWGLLHWLGMQQRVKHAVDAGMEYALPHNFEDVVYTGKSHVNGFLLRQYGLYSFDEYQSIIDGNSATVPWGIGALSAETQLDNGDLTISAGGSHQNFYNGKRFGPVVSRVKVHRSNGTISADVQHFKTGAWLLDGSLSLEYMNWDGTQTVSPSSDPNIQSDSTLNTSAGNASALLSLHAGATRKWKELLFNVNAIGCADMPGKTAWVDPGMKLTLDMGGKNSIELNEGIVTSRPDIRGLPDSAYRNTLSKTYGGSLIAKSHPVSWLAAEGGCFLKSKHDCPMLSEVPGDLTWKTDVSGKVVVRGVYVSLDVEPWKDFFVSTAFDFAWSDRILNGRKTLYEWNIPWANKSVAKYSLLDESLELILTGYFFAGLPYRELTTAGNKLVYDPQYQHLPLYRRVDAKIQINKRIEDNPLITKYQAYIEIQNVLNLFDGWQTDSQWYWMNVRDYYWNDRMVKVPVILEYATLSFGLRVGIRL